MTPAQKEGKEEGGIGRGAEPRPRGDHLTPSAPYGANKGEGTHRSRPRIDLQALGSARATREDDRGGGEGERAVRTARSDGSGRERPCGALEVAKCVREGDTLGPGPVPTL